ncbi:hypothetical protein [Streptosporangium roseum]|uniref:hypothetical protein n=1 Tax=Streptosporangium roseum TaxID=2001 RepID=UPI0033305179
MLKLLAGAGEAHLKPFDLAEPAAFSGFAYPVVQIRDDLCEPHRLCWIWLQHRTSQAGVLVPAGRSVRPDARAQLDLAAGEVALELRPFSRGRLSILLSRTVGPSTGDEGGMVAQDVILIDGRAGLRGVEISVAQQLGGDVDGQGTPGAHAREETTAREGLQARAVS